jgi:hypothetical protein
VETKTLGCAWREGERVEQFGELTIKPRRRAVSVRPDTYVIFRNVGLRNISLGNISLGNVGLRNISLENVSLGNVSVPRRRLIVVHTYPQILVEKDLVDLTAAGHNRESECQILNFTRSI